MTSVSNGKAIDHERRMYTAFGQIEQIFQLQLGVSKAKLKNGKYAYIVPIGAANKILSTQASAIAITYGKYFNFDQDTQWAVLALELPGIRHEFMQVTTPDQDERHLIGLLSLHHPDYLTARGITKLSAPFRLYKQIRYRDQLVRSRHADVITHAEELRPGVLRVSTAAGTWHHITERSFEALPLDRIFRVSDCELADVPAWPSSNSAIAELDDE